MQLLALSEADCVLAGGLEIVARLDQPRAERAHREVLFAAVAVRHDDRRRETQPGSGIGNALAVIAAGRGDDAPHVRFGTTQIVEIDETAAQFEGADRRVVLVLDPDLGTDPLSEQRPAILRGRRHDAVDQRGGGFERCEIAHAY